MEIQHEMSHIEINRLAEGILEDAQIEPCYKPSVARIVAAAGLRAAPALNLAVPVYSKFKINNSENPFVDTTESIMVNASKNEAEQRFATVYQVAFYLIYKDIEGDHESLFTNSEIQSPSNTINLTCAILMNEGMFREKFSKALKGIPNSIAVCKNLATKFGVPPFAAEHRARYLELYI